MMLNPGKESEWQNPLSQLAIVTERSDRSPMERAKRIKGFDSARGSEEPKPHCFARPIRGKLDTYPDDGPESQAPPEKNLGAAHRE